jgi:hypothetical protein
MPILNFKMNSDKFKSKFLIKKSNISSISSISSISLISSIFINIIVICVICVVIYIIAAHSKIQDKFTTAMANNPNFQDGQMKFDYLNNPLYTNDILNKYYVSNLNKINFPLRYKNSGGYYGNTVFNMTQANSNKEIYKTYKVQI